MPGRFRSHFRAGDWVRVRSREEILSTLDEHGERENLPFMPEMLAFCGKEFQVAASAHKTCDTVHYTGGRRMLGAVHLEGARCDGAAHDGCQARCLLFWKDAWLAPAGDSAPREIPSKDDALPQCNEAVLARATCNRADPASPTYSCQATRLYDATAALPSWNLLQYVADVTSRNVRLWEAVKLLSLALLYNMRRIGVGYRIWCLLYERVHHRVMGTASPYVRGTIPADSPTPSGELGLEPGEYVEVLPVESIVRTLNERNRNRGLSFDKEMVRFCGQRFRVLDRVRRIINETTGKMIVLPSPSIMLEGVYCTSQYSERRLLCPRKIPPYWREAWLRRVDPP